MQDLSRPPVSQSPLWKDGKSLLMGAVSARRGLASALADESRSADQAKVLHNFQQWRKQGIWSTRGIGYTNDNSSVINGGGRILEFGKFYDGSGNANLLLQCGNSVFPYNTGSHSAGGAIAGLTGLSTSAIPCMRPYAPSTQTTQPITVYCNGVSNPVKITSTAAAAPLAWNSGLSFQTATLGGTLTIGQKIAMNFVSTALANNIDSASYTIVASDTLATAAVGLAAAINALVDLQDAGISATAAGAVITVQYPSSISLSLTSGLSVETATVAGTIAVGNIGTITGAIPLIATETATISGSTTLGNVLNVTLTSTKIKGGGATASYTLGAAETTTTMATGLSNAVNSSAALAAAGITATSATNVVTIYYPNSAVVIFSQSATGGSTITLAAGLGTGGSATASYAAISGDTATTFAAALAAQINSNGVFAANGISATSSVGAITITSPSVLGAITWSKTVQASLTITLAAGNAPSTATATFNTITTSQAWPVTLNGKTYQNPKFCENFGDRMIYAGFPDAATMFDILITNLGSAESIFQSVPILATDAAAFTVLGTLGPVTGVKAFRPSNMTGQQVIIVGQIDGVSIITGTDTTNYSLDILTDAYGIVNNRCWAQVLDDLVFLTNKGIYTFSSIVNNNTLPEDALSFFVSDKIQQMDFTSNASQFFAVHHPITQEIQFWGPWTIDNGLVQRALVFSYKGGMNNACWSTKDGFTISSGTDFQNTMFGGGYDGHVQLHYSGNTYNGNTILFDYVSSMITVGNISQAGRMRNFAVVTDGQGQQYAINAYYYSKFADGSCRRMLASPSQFIVQDAQEGTTVFPWQLGLSSFPGDFVKTHNFAPMGRGYAWEIELTNSNVAGDGLDYSSVNFTISIGGFLRK